MITVIIGAVVYVVMIETLCLVLAFNALSELWVACT